MPWQHDPGRYGEREEAEAVRIGTWNGEYAAGQEKYAPQRAVLERHACDVWVLIETHDELELTATHAAVHSAQRPTGRFGGRWGSTWMRFPVLRQLEVVDPRRTVAALMGAPTGPLIVYGTVSHGRATAATWNRQRQCALRPSFIVSSSNRARIGHPYAASILRQTFASPAI